MGQINWMKPYIVLNIKLRTTAKNEFEKDFLKLMNKSVFGKTMKFIRNHKDMKLVASRKRYARYVIKAVLFCRDGENPGHKMRR